MSFTVTFCGTQKTYENPLTVLDIIGDDKSVICVKVNNRIRELTYTIDKDSSIIPLTVKDRDAKATYEASLRFIVAMAMKRIAPKLKIRFTYSISRSIYLEVINGDKSFSFEMVEKLKNEVDKIVKEDIPLIRHIVSKDEAKNIYKQLGETEKIELLKYRPENTAHIYTCAEYKNYMYQRMVPSTGYISSYNFKYYLPGIIIQYPRFDCEGEIPVFEDAPTYSKTLKRAHEMASIIGADNIVGINKILEENGANDLINLSEAIQSRQLTEIGDMISSNADNLRLICIAGPSSSGKTTFANKLRIELLSRGIKPIRISLDDYYLSREEVPLGDDGKPDLESIDALDIALFNRNMADLISGREVTLPHFDFEIKKRVPGRTISIDSTNPIIIEGIHALNDKLTPSISSHQKFKIFIAPQAQINIDNYNPLSTTDIRLLRRIVRDHQFRNCGALETISMWASVRKGEFKWIYKTQEGADYVFNSILTYELCVMRKYALPLLTEINTENEYFPIAERLIRLLKFFKDIPDETIPCNSLIREFIGGSCFKDV